MSEPTIPSTPMHLNAALSQSLGEVVIAWSRIEALVGELLTFAVSANRGAMYAINQQVPVTNQVKWIRTLIDRFPEKTRTELFGLLQRIDVIREERNAYIHGLWMPG